MKKRRILCVILSLTVFCALFAFLTRLLVPKHAITLREGALVGEYYLEADKDSEHQILFLGDCEAYECFIPAIIFEECGLTAYVRGSPAARVWQSYYLLLDTLRYEKPDVVVLSVYALCHGEVEREAYNRLALDGMRLSKIKFDAIKASMTEGENLASYIFPILRYHSRWSQLSREDVDYLFERKVISHNGYLLRTGSISPDKSQLPEPLFDSRLPPRALEYLDKIRAVCEREGITLVLLKSPTQSATYYWYDEWNDQICDYAAQYGIDYHNMINNEEIAIIGSDYADGVHLNFFGAEKTSRYFARVLKSKYFASSPPPDEQTCELWQAKIDRYYMERNKYSEEKK